MAIILGIETSCDETGVGVVEVKSQKLKVKSIDILGEELASSVDLQAEYGGVVPELASRVHAEKINTLIEKCLKKSKLDWNDIDAIAVANGPGLVGALLVGVMTAKTLAMVIDKPLIAVNHLEGHIASSFLVKKEENFQFSISNFQKERQNESQRSKVKSQKNIFPILVLIVSGGHTELVLMKDFGKYEMIGSTIDDAVGEAFDKTAKILGLPYPGGPSISKAAEEGDNLTPERFASAPLLNTGEGKERRSQKLEYESIRDELLSSGFDDVFNLPRPMIDEDNFDFSFSGLKTAVLYRWKEMGEKLRITSDELREGEKITNYKLLITNGEKGKIKDKSQKFVNIMAREFQKAAVDVLVAKTVRAAEKFGVGRVAMVGGVAANKFLREQMEKGLIGIGKELIVPPIKYCTDNGVKIAVAGAIKYQIGQFTDWKNIDVDGNLGLGGG